MIFNILCHAGILSLLVPVYYFLQIIREIEKIPKTESVIYTRGDMKFLFMLGAVSLCFSVVCGFIYRCFF